jgi:hypothetical protein
MSRWLEFSNCHRKTGRQGDTGTGMACVEFFIIP